MTGRPAGVDDPLTMESLRAYLKLMRAAKSVVARLEPGLAQERLTPTQLGVLEAIFHKGPLTQRDLGRKLLSSAGNMTDVIDKLERRDLVRRSRKPGDRRAVRVELTPAGAAAIEGLFPRHAAAIVAAMGGLEVEELRRLGDLLRKLGLAAAAGQTEPLGGEPDVNQPGEA